MLFSFYVIRIYCFIINNRNVRLFIFTVYCLTFILNYIYDIINTKKGFLSYIYANNYFPMCPFAYDSKALHDSSSQGGRGGGSQSFSLETILTSPFTLGLVS